MAIAGNAFYDNTEIYISGGDVISEDGVAVYHPQEGTMEITGGSIKGTSGVYVKAGEVMISDHAEIEGTEEAEFDLTNNGANGTGAAVVVETNVAGGYGSAPEIEINEGTFISIGNAVPIQTEAAEDEEVVTGFVYGGLFSESILNEDVLADELTVELNQPSEEVSYTYYPDEEAAKDVLLDNEEGGIITVAGSEAITYNFVEIDSNGGNADEKKVVVKGTVLEQPAAEKSGYRLLNWEADGIVITFPYAVENDVILEAKWQQISRKKSSKKNTTKVEAPVTEAPVTETPAEETENDVVKPVPSKPEDVVKEEAIILKIGETTAQVFGKEVTNDVAPVIKDGRTTLPIRMIAEAMRATVNWDGETQKVTIEKEGLSIELFIGLPYAKVNGTPVQLDVPGFIENDRTFLPVKFIAENLGATVLWDDVTKEVLIVPASE